MKSAFFLPALLLAGCDLFLIKSPALNTIPARYPTEQHVMRRADGSVHIVSHYSGDAPDIWFDEKGGRVPRP